MRLTCRLRPSWIVSSSSVGPRRRTFAGEEGQVDWASFGHVLIGSARRALSAFVMTLTASAGANAQSFEDALAKFTTDSFNETDAGIAAVATSGNPLAAQIIEALQDGRLQFGDDKKVYVRERAGTLLEAATGKPVAGAAPANLKTVRLNNRLRRSLEAALGGLTLLSPDASKRFEAAQAVFKSKDAAALPALDTAIGREKDARLKKMLQEARAAVILFMADAKEVDKLAAVVVIRERGDQDARGLLAGLPGNQPEAVQRLAAEAIGAIDAQLAMWSIAQNLWYGLSLGSVLLLAATAYVDVVRDQAIVRLGENNVNVLSNQLKATRDQFAVGEVTRTDVAQAEARRAGAVAALEVSRGNLQASRAVFERLVGSPPGRLVETGEPSRLMPKSLADSTSIAQRENPLIVNALYLEQAARYAIEQIRGELLPTVSLNASYSRAFDPSRTVDQSDARTITTTMTVPIYSGGDIEARVRAAKHTHVARIQQIEQVRTEQLSLVVGAWARYSAAKAQGVSTAAQVRANQTALTGVREEYRVGQRTLLDVLNAEQELLNSQVSEVTARRDATVQAFTLLQTVGRLTPAEMALGEEIYDPEIHYFEIRRKWFGLSITHADGRREKVDATWEPVTHKPAK